MPKWLWTAFFLALIAGGSYGLYLYLLPERLPEQVVYGNGHVEGTEIRVPAEVGGRIVESRLVEGRAVEQGDLLVRLDDMDLTLEREQAEAEITALRRQRERVQRELALWRHHRAVAERDLARHRELLADDAISPREVEQVENTYEEASGQVAALEAEVSTVDARITSAEKKVARIARQLEKTRVPAPIDGTVLSKLVEAGEFVPAGRPVAVVMDLARMELKVFIPQADVGVVRLGAPARVRVDAYPERQFEARVARVDQEAQFTPRDIHMPRERERLVFGVTLTLENPEGVLKPGMPADAWILRDEAADWPERLFVPQ